VSSLRNIQRSKWLWCKNFNRYSRM
jgi:hypothetical protein